MDPPGASSDFLSSLLENMELGTNCFSFQEEKEEVQNTSSPIFSLPDKCLDRILSFIPLKERIISTGSVCQKLRESMKRSVTSIGFCKDQIDGLSDTHLKYFLSIYGSKIHHLNFDLFKSSFIEECTQWVWRQSVISTVSLCRNLRDINILICQRHRLRDTDLSTIFREAPLLESLSVDAQYLNGHCFQFAPANLQRLEMEMCYRFAESSMKYIFRLKKLKVLHFSQLLALRDSMIYRMVSDLRGLTHLSIVSHQDSVYCELSGTGLSQLGRLPCLQSLCLEGLTAVTDRFLQEFSEEKFSAVNTLESLSLAFCYNFGTQGMQQLSRLTKLANLNLDGVVKRDMSIGLEKIAQQGRLARLLLSEGTNVSPESLKRIVHESPRLRLLDITNNNGILNWHTANQILSLVAHSCPSRPQLVILTNDVLPWNMVVRPPVGPSGIDPVKVVHVHRATMRSCDIPENSVLSAESPHQLPFGVLCPLLRRGNRYRLLWEGLGPGYEAREKDEKENNPLLMSSPPPMYPCGDQQSFTGGFSPNMTSSGPPPPYLAPFNPSRPPPLASVGNIQPQQQMPPNGACMPIPGWFPPFNPVMMAQYAAEKAMAGSDSSGLSSEGKTGFGPNSGAQHGFQSHPFSYAPISPAGDPHTNDWSLDVLNLLMSTYAYRDGANIGPLHAKEGILYLPDGSVGPTDTCCSSTSPTVSPPTCPGYVPSASAVSQRPADGGCLTAGSGGAPRPPVQIPPQPVFHYTRGPRTKRKSMPKPQRKPEPKFDASDFPPLASSVN